MSRSRSIAIIELRLYPCRHGRTTWHWISGRRGVGATCTYGRREVVFENVTDVTDVSESVTERIVN